MRPLILAIIAVSAFMIAGPTDLDAKCGGGSGRGLFGIRGRMADRRAARQNRNASYQSSYSFQSSTYSKVN